MSRFQPSNEDSNGFDFFLGDIATQPGSKVVFNVHYDEKHTYHVKVMNSLAGCIGWAFKTIKMSGSGTSVRIAQPQGGRPHRRIRLRSKRHQQRPHHYHKNKMKHVVKEAPKQFRLEWAFKTISMCRLEVEPPCGGLDRKEAILIAVSCDAFAYV